MDEFLSYFSADYNDARARFLAAAQARGAVVTHHQNPVTGPTGARLWTDVTAIGPPRASRRLLVVSATHGAEGFCGSGIQVGLLAASPPLDLPPDTRLVLIHAINPYGFAWLRRVTEDNVDLNRNIVDHDAGSYPENPGYESLAAALVPERWDPESRAATGEILRQYGEKHGLFGLQAAISLGQYTHADGLFYGGRAPTWSRRTLEEAVATLIDGAAHAALIDLHTGLGPYGYGEPICVHAPGSEAHGRAKQWYGADVTSPYDGTAGSANSTSAAITGHLNLGCEAAAPATSWTSITLEFGTQPIDDVIDALRADAWLHRHGDLDSELGRQIKATLRATFYGDEHEWKQRIWSRGRDLVVAALAGLSGQ